jgi:Family of unknown function (DUF5691)
MDSILRAALIGTRESGATPLATATPIDSLALPAYENERELLLKAGARAIYAQAGYTPVQAAAPPCAPKDDRPVCSPKLTELMKLVFSNSDDQLQILTFSRLQESAVSLSPELLPPALAIKDKDKQRLLYPLLGKRGLWISQFNPAWSWVSEILDVPDDTAPADAQALWQEGSDELRLEILRRIRRTDPGRAREWTLECWKQEKAEFRVEMLRVLKTHLGPEDEPLLEHALDDRAGGVRAAAAETLRSLTTGALAGRLLVRAGTMITCTNGTLKVTPPTSIDGTWQRDGIIARAGSQKGERSSWLVQVISCVPPNHWERQFGMTPEVLIAAAGQTRWESALLEAWTQAALTFGSDSWLMPLWNRWAQPGDKGEVQQRSGQMYALLAPNLPHPLQEETAMRLLRDPSAQLGPSFSLALTSVAAPWTRALGDEYLAGLRAFVGHLDKKSNSSDPWGDTLSFAATALPVDCLAEAAQPLVVPDENRNWYIQQFQHGLDTFQSVVELRASIEKELAK